MWYFQRGGWMSDCGYVREYESVLDYLKSYKFHPATSFLTSVQYNDYYQTFRYS